jgi:signal transduction histidine kinase
VLYVDDDASNLVVFEASVGAVLPVLTANSGEAALRLLAQHEVAVVMADQRMPGMSGVELLERVHADYPDVVRVIITAYSDLEASIDAINRGHVDAYFKKPWEPRELKVSLAEAQRRYQEKKRARELERRLLATERAYALGVVAAGIAHELRTPLTALSLSVHLAQSLLEDGRLDDAARQTLTQTLADCAHAVESIIEITQSMELSTRRREVAQVDLKEIVEAAAVSVRGELRRKGELELELAEVPPLLASRTQLGQVVLNLLVNAVQALDEAKRATNRVRVELRRENGSLVLSVSDTGSGIDAETLGRIFDPFFTTREEGGTGLGLAISRRIIGELGGTIDVSSVPREGTTFRVKLPLPQP